MRTIDCQKGNDVLGFVSVDAETGVGPPAEVPGGTLPCRHRTFYLGALDSGRTHESGCSAFGTLGRSQEVNDRIKAPIGLFGRACTPSYLPGPIKIFSRSGIN
jgi:predicted anti-sigma-YlaC factor YlaD